MCMTLSPTMIAKLAILGTDWLLCSPGGREAHLFVAVGQENTLCMQGISGAGRFGAVCLEDVKSSTSFIGNPM